MDTDGYEDEQLDALERAIDDLDALVVAKMSELKDRVRALRAGRLPTPPEVNYLMVDPYMFHYPAKRIRAQVSEDEFRLLRLMQDRDQAELADVITGLCLRDKDTYYQLQRRLNKRLRTHGVPFHFGTKRGFVELREGVYEPPNH